MPISQILCCLPTFNFPMTGIGSPQITQSNTIPRIAVDQKWYSALMHVPESSPFQYFCTGLQRKMTPPTPQPAAASTSTKRMWQDQTTALEF